MDWFGRETSRCFADRPVGAACSRRTVIPPRLPALCIPFFHDLQINERRRLFECFARMRMDFRVALGLDHHGVRLDLGFLLGDLPSRLPAPAPSWFRWGLKFVREVIFWMTTSSTNSMSPIFCAGGEQRLAFDNLAVLTICSALSRPDFLHRFLHSRRNQAVERSPAYLKSARHSPPGCDITRANPFTAASRRNNIGGNFAVCWRMVTGTTVVMNAFLTRNLPA